MKIKKILTILVAAALILSLAVVASAEEIGTETNTPVAEFVGKQVNLGGDISMKFHVRNNEDRPLESIAIEVEFLGKLTYLTECEPHPTEDKVYIYTFEGVGPQCLGDLMNVTILVGGSPVGHKNAILTGYSVEQNLNEIYNDCTEAQKQLIDDLRAYGKASEVYTGHTSMTGTNYPVREVEIPEASITTTDTADDVNLHTASVRFGTMNYLMFKFAFASGTPYDLGDKVKIDGEAPADAYIDGNYYVVISKPISPENFHKDISLDYDESKLTLSYSINDYCRTVVDGDHTEEMKTLAQALYNYGLSAHIAEGNHEGGTATCAAQKVCTICGNGYGTLLDHNFTYTADDDANTITESCDKGCNHSKTITLKAPENAVYNGNAHQASVEGAIDAEYDLTYNTNPVDAGSYTATLTAGGKSVSVTYTIEKGTPAITAPTANELTYTGESQTLVTAGTTTGGTMMYSWTIDGPFTESIPMAMAPGKYTVWYVVWGDSNYNGMATPERVDVTIAKQVNSDPISAVTVSDIASTSFKVTVGEDDREKALEYKINDGEYQNVMLDAGGSFIVMLHSSLAGEEMTFCIREKEHDYVAAGTVYSETFQLLPASTIEAKWGDSADTLTNEGTLADAIAAKPAYIKLLANTSLFNGATLSSTAILDLNGYAINAATGATLYNSGNLTITGGNYNGRIENNGTMVINANIGGDVEAYSGKLTVIGGTLQSLTAHSEYSASLKGGTFNKLKLIINRPIGMNDAVLSGILYKLLANGKEYSHYDIDDALYNSEGYIHTGFGDIAKAEAWFTSPVSVLELKPNRPYISTQPVDAGYTWSDPAVALSVVATNDDDGGILSYQWYSDTDDDATGGTAITDATEATYTPPTDVIGTAYYYCVVTNSKTGFASESTTSKAVKVTVEVKNIADEEAELEITLDQTSYQYDGNVKEPKVTSIVVDGRTLTEGIDYTISYENNVYVGEKATVVINFMGNYDGTFKKYFTITQDPNTTEFDGEWVTVPTNTEE